MSLTQDDVVHILKLVDQAPIGRFSLQVGDLTLEVSKGVAAGPPVAAPAVAVPAAAPVTVAAVPAATADDPRLVPIPAPLLGTFYVRPEPGAPPYVEPGALVDADTTVALIEVMKLFNPVKAGIKGRIAKVCAENGALVEYEQALFLVDPE